MLHLPLPAISNFSPTDEFFSIRTTLAPLFAAIPAAKSPAGPPPITDTSNFSMKHSFQNYADIANQVQLRDNAQVFDTEVKI
jgi:hypothetical protein